MNFTRPQEKIIFPLKNLSSVFLFLLGGWVVTKNLYFIAANMKIEGFNEPSTGLWASNSLESGMIFSVNSDAIGFSIFPDGQKGGPKVNTSDHGYIEALNCFKEKFKKKSSTPNKK
jgi:hypothetical protein